jgi:FKBP-type peptidyl-prolyl cis-trans isomerase 2
MKNGDFVKITYTGKLASTGEVFETTDEPLAKQAGIYALKGRYGQKVVALGLGQMIRGIEEAVRTLSPGKQESFLFHPNKAFGERNPELVRVIPLSKFHSQGVNPSPGMMVALDNRLAAKVKSVAGGRVTVDLNHPLAGENVVYSIKLEEVISDTGKKVQALLDSAFLEAEYKISGSSLEIRFLNRDKTPDQAIMEQSLLASVKAYIPEIKEIKPMADGKKADAKNQALTLKPEAKESAKPAAKAAAMPPEARKPAVFKKK